MKFTSIRILALCAMILSTSACNKKIERGATAEPAKKTPAVAQTSNGSITTDPITQAALDQDSTARIFYAQIAAKSERGTTQEKVSALMEFADYMMFQAPVPPRIKYRPALKAYREVLALDPANADAAKNKKQIEDIYAQMGMPVPQD